VVAVATVVRRRTERERDVVTELDHPTERERINGVSCTGLVLYRPITYYSRLLNPLRRSGDDFLSALEVGDAKESCDVRVPCRCSRTTLLLEVESLHGPEPEAARRRALSPSWKTTQGRKEGVKSHTSTLCQHFLDLRFRLHSYFVSTN